MKTIFSILTVALLLTLISCKKKQNKSLTVLRDCTGTYLRLEGKSYHVCNLEKLSPFKDGAKVTATLKKIENCTRPGETSVCLMLHVNEGWVEITEVRAQLDEFTKRRR